MLSFILITDENRLRDMEGWPVLNMLARCPAFIPANSEVATFGGHRLPLVQAVTHGVEQIATCSAQAFYRFRHQPYHQTVDADESSDDGWNGLPAGEIPAQELV